MGFQVFESPHVETDLNNFELLNFPKHHPARDLAGIRGFQILDEKHALALVGGGVDVRHVVGDDIHLPLQDHLAR